MPFGDDGRDVVLLVDTFARWFEPGIAHAAEAVLAAAGYRVHLPELAGARPLCCGRTFLAVGLVEEARREAERTLAALAPLVERGLPVIGLEPSCLLTLRDEYLALRPGPATEALAGRALLFEEFLWQEQTADRLQLPLRPPGWRRALLHGHCHQKAFEAMAAIEGCLGLIPELEVETIASSCCGMAGAFGYEAEAFRDLPADGRAVAAAGGARGAGRGGRGRRRDQLPASDRGRHRARGAPRRRAVAGLLA